MKCISVFRPRFLWLICLLMLSCEDNRNSRIPVVVVESAEDIVPIDNIHEVPLVLYHNQFSFARLPVEEKKQKFIDMLLPSILAAQKLLADKYDQTNAKLIELHSTGELSITDSLWLNDLQKSWHASSYWDLRKRLKPNPTSLILAQAAIESGWGESRMFREANNLFGVWSFNKNEPRIKAQAMRGSQAVYLRKYPSAFESIYDHLKVFGTVAAYRKFRNARIETDDPLAMSNYLNNYSELGEGYVYKVKQVIRQNSLQVYDSATLDPSYDLSVLKTE